MISCNPLSAISVPKQTKNLIKVCIPPNRNTTSSNWSGYAQTMFSTTLYNCRSLVNTVKSFPYFIVSDLALYIAVIMVSGSDQGKVVCIGPCIDTLSCFSTLLSIIPIEFRTFFCCNHILQECKVCFLSHACQEFQGWYAFFPFAASIFGFLGPL